MIESNPNSLLIIYEGETEAEFYKKIFEDKVPARKIRRNYGNLKGNFSINKKTIDKIQSYLENNQFKSLKNIHVFIAYDRDGPREKETQLDIDYLRGQFIYKRSRIKSINEIIATQDLESWFFHDIEGIYTYLRVPKRKRKYNAYNNVEATNNRILSELFHRYNKHYQKGRRVEGFLNHLDLNKIFNKVIELNDAVVTINNLC
jgi:hypothetical protein